MKSRLLEPAHHLNPRLKREVSDREDRLPGQHDGVFAKWCRRPSHRTLVFLAMIGSPSTGFSQQIAAQESGRRDSMDAETVLAAVGSRQPLPSHSVESLFGMCDTRGACPEIWNMYCAQESRTAMLSEARACEAFDCVEVTVRAAQLEAECTTVPKIVLMLNKDRHRPPVPHDETRGFTSTVTRLAQERIRVMAARVSQCRAKATPSGRCLVTEGALLAGFDDYMEWLRSGLSRFPRLLASHFVDLSIAATAEMERLTKRANALDQSCQVQAEDPEMDVEALLAGRGCTPESMPASRIREIRESLQSIKDHKRKEAENREEEAAQSELARASQIATECSQKLRSMQDTKMQSSGCRSARAEEQALITYCSDVRDLKSLDAELAHMRRVDIASGTVNPQARRNIVETRLILEDRARRAKDMLIAAGRKPDNCKPEGAAQAKRRTAEACVVPRPNEILPECTSVCWPSPCAENLRNAIAGQNAASGGSSAHLLSSSAARARLIPAMREVEGADLPAGAGELTRVQVGKDGHVESVIVLQANPRTLGDAILQDVRCWKFRPYLSGGNSAPFYLFERIEPRRASAVVTCNSKAWPPFKDALRTFCSQNQKVAGCVPNIGECAKNANERILPIRVPADHDDFEYVLQASEGSEWVAKFHWADGWVVTGVGVGPDDRSAESTLDSSLPANSAIPSQATREREAHQ
jgi:hypothetical protein